MNAQLTNLYQNKWNDLLRSAEGTKSAYPLLLSVHKEYQEADLRVMIVGQETDGWEGELEKGDKSIESLKETYYNYYHTSKDKNRRGFWNRKGFLFFKEELTRHFSDNKIAFLWNNVSKLGHAHRGGAQGGKIAELEADYFDVFEEEFKITKPDIVIFLVGDRRIPIAHEHLNSVGQNPVSKVKLRNYPDVLCVRTYHPNARIKGGKSKFKRDVVDLVKSENITCGWTQPLTSVESS